jgi:hypothetical protein
MDNNFKNKYFKYKQKYYSLKEQNKNNINVLQNTFNSIKNKYYMKYQKGGVIGIINTIPNNGSDGTNSQQCIWISIRDYLNYHRGEIRTVRILKELVGLPATTDTTQYDDANVQLRRGLELLCELLDISIHFIGTRSNGNIIPFNLENNRMVSHHIINRGNPNILYIAAFGSHFEPIIKGPSNYVLTLDASSSFNTAQPVYQPKVLIKKTFVTPSTITDINELQLSDAISRLNEIQLQIDFFKEGLNELEEVAIKLAAILKNIKQANLIFGTAKINAESYIKLNIENIREIGERTIEIKNLEQEANDLKTSISILVNEKP